MRPPSASTWTLATRFVAVLFAFFTYSTNFDSPHEIANTVGCGFVAVTFALLSLGGARRGE